MSLRAWRRSDSERHDAPSSSSTIAAAPRTRSGTSPSRSSSRSRPPASSTCWTRHTHHHRRPTTRTTRSSSPRSCSPRSLYRNTGTLAVSRVRRVPAHRRRQAPLGPAVTQRYRRPAPTIATAPCTRSGTSPSRSGSRNSPPASSHRWTGRARHQRRQRPARLSRKPSWPAVVSRADAGQSRCEPDPCRRTDVPSGTDVCPAGPPHPPGTDSRSCRAGRETTKYIPQLSDSLSVSRRPRSSRSSALADPAAEARNRATGAARSATREAAVGNGNGALDLGGQCALGPRRA